MMKRDFGQVVTNKLEIIQSPLTILPGMEPVFSVRIAGTGTLATPTMKLFKGTKDVSTTNLSGAMSIAGRVVTCKKIITLSQGDWVFYIYYTDGGILEERFCRFYVPKEGA